MNSHYIGVIACNKTKLLHLNDPWQYSTDPLLGFLILKISLLKKDNLKKILKSHAQDQTANYTSNKKR